MPRLLRRFWRVSSDLDTAWSWTARAAPLAKPVGGTVSAAVTALAGFLGDLEPAVIIVLALIAADIGAWLLDRALLILNRRRKPNSPLQQGIVEYRQEAFELRQRLRHLPDHDEWRQREYLNNYGDKINEWVSGLYGMFGSNGALELRNEFSDSIDGPSGDAMFQREPLIGFLDDAIKRLDEMHKQLQGRWLP